MSFFFFLFSLLSLPLVSLSIAQKCWFFHYFLVQIAEASVWCTGTVDAHKKMTSLPGITKVPLLLLDCPSLSQLYYPVKQHNYPSVSLLLKMQKRSGVAQDSRNFYCLSQILGLLSLEKSLQCSWVHSFRASPLHAPGNPLVSPSMNDPRSCSSLQSCVASFCAWFVATLLLHGA